MPRIPIWAVPIFVIIAAFGKRTLAISAISPLRFIPSSNIPASCSGRTSKTERGKPVSEFKFPFVDTVLYFLEYIEAKISFVVVFPLDPVIPIL